MATARVNTVSAEGYPVLIEAHVGPGLPGFDIVGQPGRVVREVRDRCMASFDRLGLDWPMNRVTVHATGHPDYYSVELHEAATALAVILATEQPIVGRLAGDTSSVEVCPVCEGPGYLLDQGYGYTEPPPGAVPVQRCDACSRFEGDLDAAHAAAVNLGLPWLATQPPYGATLDADGNIAPVVDDDGVEHPGDAWVVIPQEARS